MTLNTTNSGPLAGASEQEAVVMPELPIVDSHIHLWNVAGYDYFAPDYLSDVATGHKVEASIFVECGMAYSRDERPEYRPVGETEFVVEHTRGAHAVGHKLAAAILANADLTLGAAIRPVLEAQIQAGQGRVRGIRYRAAWDEEPGIAYASGHPNKGVMTTDSFIEGARCFCSLGLILELWAFHTQLEEVQYVAAQLPDQTIVVNHVGGPLGIGRFAGKRDEVFAVWSAHIRELSKLPNVQIKIGGLGLPRAGWRFGPTGQTHRSDDLVQAWTPYVQTCLDAFGPGRAIYGSNFPVDRAAASFRVNLNAFKKMLAGFSDDERKAVFAGNARRVYSID